MKFYIYKVTNLITNQIYVGQTMNFDSRLKDYKNNRSKEQKQIYQKENAKHIAIICREEYIEYFF